MHPPSFQHVGYFTEQSVFIFNHGAQAFYLNNRHKKFHYCPERS